MKVRVSALGVSAVLLCCLLGCDEKVWRSRVRLVSMKTETAPQIDGLADVGLWDQAQNATATLRLLGGPPEAPQEVEVYLRSLHTDTDVYFLVQWHTPRKSDVCDPFVWRGDHYEPVSQQEDALGLQFEIKGKYERLLETGQEYRADYWDWGAGRTNASGYARDAQLVLGGLKMNANANYFEDVPTKTKLWWWDPSDAGKPPFRVKAPGGRNQGDVVPQFVPQRPTGSQADVRAVGRWDEEQKMWTLEFARKLRTNHYDDAQFDLSKITPMCVSAAMVDEQGRPLRYLSPFMQLAFSGESAKWDFADYRPGERVMGLQIQSGTWIAKSDPTAPSPPMAYGQVALQQRDDVMPAVVYAGGIYADFTLSASIRLLPGSSCSAGGLLFRQYDLFNYYLLEISAATGVVRFRKFVGGKEMPLMKAEGSGDPAAAKLPTQAECDIRRDAWYALRVVCKGNLMVGYLNEKPFVAAVDGATMNGGVGLWTRGDTIAHFDDLAVTAPIAKAAAPAAQPAPSPQPPAKKK